MAQPNYHLRPHKSIDRNLFCESLTILSSVFLISEYRYIGFGSYEFEEFKNLHRQLRIGSMHSIEMDPDVYRRQEFNKPFRCIQLFNKTSETYIDEDYDESESSIIWLDFSSAHEKAEQLRDVQNIACKLKSGDILRITLNASPSSIKISKEIRERPEFAGVDNEDNLNKQKMRFLALKDQISDFIPSNLSYEDVTTDKYSKLLLNAVKLAVYEKLDSSLSVIPLSAYAYEDGQKMLTITMIMLNKQGELVQKVTDKFSTWPFATLDWERILPISLPPLTLLERLKLNQLLPYTKEDDVEKFCSSVGIDRIALEAYRKFYMYYPNYQHFAL